MTSLPMIVGMGGINAAGRTSFHQGYRRIIIDSLNKEAREETFLGLASLMNLVKTDNEQLVDQQGNAVSKQEIETRFGQEILAGTLIRKIEKNHFDVDATPWHQKMTLSPTDTNAKEAQSCISFETSKKDLPSPLPRTWVVTELESGKVKVDIPGEVEFKHNATRDNPIKAAGQLPTGFEPASLYNSRYQPRGLQTTIFAASDAIHSTGFSWSEIMAKISPDEVGTYSASVAGQMQEEGFGGLIRNRLLGSRVSTKQLALGLNTMSTDFINAYVTGSVGTTFTSSGACATFLYNLRTAVDDIKAGRVRVAIVGSAESAITPEIIEGFGNMSALANEEGLKRLDQSDVADHRRASRPFGQNCGFTIGEGAQFAILMDDELVIELGATVLGSVPEVFVNADGFKKSITAPGPGNYITMAKSVALANSILGEESITQRSFILAHGSSTPQNRVTESAIYHRLAESFTIDNWPVVAPKAYVGHTIGPASGDQLAVALGVFAHNIMPGITTIDKVADDVFDQHLNISVEHWACEPMDVAFINSKGFGGNNASAAVFSPNVSMKMLAKRHGNDSMQTYQEKRTHVEAAQARYKASADNGDFSIIYKFGEGVIDDADLEITKESIVLPGFDQAINLPSNNPFKDMC